MSINCHNSQLSLESSCEAAIPTSTYIGSFRPLAEQFVKLTSASTLDFNLDFHCLDS